MTSLVVPVSGAQQKTLMSGDTRCFQKVMNTLSEMDRVANTFEGFRTQINSMGLHHPYHSVVPQVLYMLQSTAAPVGECQQREFAEDLKMTVQSIMPWDKFLEYSSGV